MKFLVTDIEFDFEDSQGDIHLDDQYQTTYDSLDRERVRDILLEEYNYKYVGEQSPLNCPYSISIKQK